MRGGGKELDNLTTRLVVAVPAEYRREQEKYKMVFCTTKDNHGEAHITDRLPLNGDKISYTLPSGLMQAGELKMQLRIIGDDEKILHTAVGALFVDESLGTETNEKGMPPNYAGLYEGKAEELQAAAEAAKGATNEATDAAQEANWAAGSAVVAAENATTAAEAANAAAAKVNNKVDADDFSRLIPLHTFTPNPDPLDPGDWIVTPTIGNLEKPPTAGMMIRAIFSAEWNAPSNLWFGGSMTIIGPVGTYPAGTYLLTLDITGGVMSWQIQGAEPIGPTADALEAKANRQDTASVITGTATGEVAHLPEAAVGSRLRALTIGGKTIETGTGDKGPQNPYTLAGVQPGQLTISGKNLLDLSGISITGGCTYSLDGDILTVTKNTSDIGFWGVSLTVYLDVGSYFIKANSVSSDGAGVGISVVQNKDFVFNQATTSNPAGSFTVNAAGEFTVHFYVSRSGPAGTTTTFTDIQLERGTAATDYEPYSGSAVYPLPITTPLFGLPDGTADTYSDAGEQVIRIGSMTLVPDMMWEVSARTNTTRFVSAVQANILLSGAYNAVLCNHLPTAEVYTADAVGVCLHEGSIVLSMPGNWDTTALYDWLAVPPGGTVTVYYPAAEPTTTQLDGIAVTVPALDTYISAQGAPVTAEYNKDTTAVIAALTARIAALEGGGGA